MHTARSGAISIHRDDSACYVSTSRLLHGLNKEYDLRQQDRVDCAYLVVGSGVERPLEHGSGALSTINPCQYTGERSCATKPTVRCIVAIVY